MKDGDQVSITFRLTKDERREIDHAIGRIGDLAGFGNRSVSRIFRLAVGFVDQSIRDAEEAGQRDREAGRSFNELFERPSDNGLLEARAASYRRAFFDEAEGQASEIDRYRAGKAQAEKDRANGKPSWLKGPLTAASGLFDVGYFDGYRGGFMAGLNEGKADRERHDTFWARALESEPGAEPEPDEVGGHYGPPDDDPLFRSGYAMGYRTGFRGRDPEWRAYLLEVAADGPAMPFIPDGPSFPAYQDAYRKGDDDRDRGAPYDPAPAAGLELDEDDGRLWAEGYDDGFRGGIAAGLREGMADWLNGKPAERMSGQDAFTDFAIGYRAGHGEDFNADDRRDRGFADYLDGRALGIHDQENRAPNPFVRNFLVRNFLAGFQRHPDCPFAAGYRAGREVQDTEYEAFAAGFAEGANCREQGRPPPKDRWSDGPRDAGFRAAYRGVSREPARAQTGPADSRSDSGTGSVRVEVRRKRTVPTSG